MDYKIQPEKSVIICYSYSGNTWKVAEEIRRQTGIDLCEIYPKQPYSTHFESILADVRDEIDTGYLPSLFPVGKDIDAYDTIFVGTPNWCGTVSPPITSFLKSHDLSGKVILPFYTHCGGGKGNVEKDMKLMCPNALVKDGISIVNDGGTGLSEKVSTWIEKSQQD